MDITNIYKPGTKVYAVILDNDVCYDPYIVIDYIEGHVSNNWGMSYILKWSAHSVDMFCVFDNEEEATEHIKNHNKKG